MKRSVGFTSRYTAACRVLENEFGKDALFFDPWAEKFAGTEGTEFLNKLATGMGITPDKMSNGIRVRTRYFDDQLAQVRHVFQLLSKVYLLR